MARGQRDRAKERYWRRQVAAWRRSGLSVRAYCQAQSLSEPSFYGWRRVLAQRDAAASARPKAGDRRSDKAASPDPLPRTAPRTAAAEQPLPAFVPVRLIQDAVTTPTVEVVLRGDRRVRVLDGFAAQTLRAVVAVLEELPC